MSNQDPTAQVPTQVELTDPPGVTPTEPQAPPAPPSQEPPASPPPPAPTEPEVDWKRKFDGLTGTLKAEQNARAKAQEKLTALEGEHATAQGKITELETQLASLTEAKESFDGQVADLGGENEGLKAENQKLTLVLTRYPNLAPIASGITALADAEAMEAQLKQMSEALATTQQAQVQAQVKGLVPGGSGPGAGKSPDDPGWEWVRDNIDSQDPEAAAKAQKWHDVYTREGRHPALA
jgi:regulator of replication initiation timing